jgi:hypothetical protein
MLEMRDQTLGRAGLGAALLTEALVEGAYRVHVLLPNGEQQLDIRGLTHRQSDSLGKHVCLVKLGPESPLLVRSTQGPLAA